MDFNQQKDYSKYANGKVSAQDSLPKQLLPRHKKGKKWEFNVMNTLRSIGLKQIKENRVFRDYRKMQEGRLVHTDFDETQTDLQGIAAMRKGERLPTFLKHYDLIGRIINLLAGEFNKQKDTINITSTDPFSVSEFLREKDTKIREFTEDYFNKTIEIGLIEKGLDPNKQDFKSEEEQQAYLQALKEARDSIIPPDQIERDLQKNFKTAIVEWAENTLESNYIKFSMDMLDTDEILDYLTTGRYFRNYHVGHDSYIPETWDVERTFFSQDLDVKYPSDCEYVGTMHLFSPAKLLSRYGHIIPKKIQDQIYGEDSHSSGADAISPTSFFQRGGGQATSVPHAGYYQDQVATAFENLTGTPWGQQVGSNAKGELESRYAWISDPITSFTRGSEFRDDIRVRSDQLQVFEVYFRSQRLVGLLTIENPLMNQPYQVFVEEELIPEFIEHYKIKKQSNKTWQDVTENPLDNVNTITYGYMPEIWKGHIISGENTGLKEDYCFGVEPLKYQVTGERGDFDVKIPMGGIISSGIGEKIRSFQVDYNIVLNQNRQYLEKTLGTFFLMDWNLMPSQFKGENGETSAELVEEWRDTIRDTGIGMKDSSMMNTKGLNPAQNSIQQFDISFVNNIQMNMTLARDYEAKAFAMIGITEQRAGSPNEYSTAEGVKVGQEASYAQTEIIYKRFNTAKIKEKEIELTIAQYAETNKKDISIDYINGQNERIVRNFLDPNFSLRKLKVFPSDDSNKKKELAGLKSQMLQLNTMDNDIYDLGKIVTSDNFVSLLEFGLEKRKRLDKQGQEKHAREKELADMQNKTAQEIAEKEIQRQDNKDKLDRESNEYIAEVKARATLADSNVNTDLLDRFMRKEERESKDRDLQIKNDLKQQEVDIKREKQDATVEDSLSGANLAFLELREKAKDRAARIQISKTNENIARINP